MLKQRICLECDSRKRNCVEVGCDGNYVCLDCLAFILDCNNYAHKDRSYEVEMRTEKITSENVDF